MTKMKRHLLGLLVEKKTNPYLVVISLGLFYFEIEATFKRKSPEGHGVYGVETARGEPWESTG